MQHIMAFGKPDYKNVPEGCYCSAGVRTSRHLGRMIKLLFSHPRLLSPLPALLECASTVAEADSVKEARLKFLPLPLKLIR